MGELALAAQIAGTVLGAVGSMQAGKAQQQASNYQADQMRVQAGQERASAQRAALEQRRQQRIAQSRLQAVSAASGAGALDPTVVDISGDIAGEGEYRALASLYEGEDRARGLETGAALKRYEGKLAKRQGTGAALGTVLGGASSLFDRFAQGGPPSSGFNTTSASSIHDSNYGYG